jgi:tetratricopeptide (TPR) repeat protein
MSLRHPLIAIVLAWTLSAPATAHAQAGERATTAEDLFRQALQLTKEGRFAEACPKFAESHRLDPAYGALMNLAACYEKTGQTASAWQAYVDAADLAHDKGQRARADSARKKASQLAPRLVRLQIRLGTGVEASGLEITRNGKPLDPALLGNAVPVDPGSYAIVASRQGAQPWKTSVNATEPGKTMVVELAGPTGKVPAATPSTAPAPVLPATASNPSRQPPAAPATEAPVHESEPAGARGRGMRIAGLTLAGSGAALAVTGGVFAWLSKSISDDYTNVKMGERFDPSREDRAKTYQTSAFVLWGVGAAAIAGGVTLYVLGRHKADSAGVSLAPVPLHGGAAALAAWQW